jgi:hypothetical protein
MGVSAFATRSRVLPPGKAGLKATLYAWTERLVLAAEGF